VFQRLALLRRADYTSINTDRVEVTAALVWRQVVERVLSISITFLRDPSFCFLSLRLIDFDDVGLHGSSTMTADVLYRFRKR